MLGPLLQSSAVLTQWMGQPGGRYYPYPVFMALHAARISIVFRAKVRSNSTKGRLTWQADIAGFLIMAWGGAFAIAVVLGQVPPQMFSVDMSIAYLSIHLLCTSLLYLLPIPIHHPTLDTLLFFLDAGSKSGAILAAVAACKTHVNPAINQSVFAPIILGAFAPVGGGTIGAMLQVHEQNWGFTSPPWLKPGNGLLSTLEIWTGAMAAALYALLTQAHPAYEPTRMYIGLPSKGAFTPLGARSLVVAFLTVAYGVKALLVHWILPRAKTGPIPTLTLNGEKLKNGAAAPTKSAKVKKSQ